MRGSINSLFCVQTFTISFFTFSELSIYSLSNNFSFGKCDSNSSRNGGPNIHLLPLINASLVLSSAGFSFVGTHFHSELLELSLISPNLFATNILKLRGSFFIQNNTVLESDQNTRRTIVKSCCSSYHVCKSDAQNSRLQFYT